MSKFIEIDAPADVNLLIHRDADYVIPLTFKESEDGDPIDLTGYTLSCEFLPLDLSTPLLEPTVTITNAVAGEIQITLARASTADPDVMPDDHVWRLWWTAPTAQRQLKISGRVRMEAR